MADGVYVSYLRVSTQRQGRSGLGLEAQKTAVREFLNGGNWQLMDEFIEVESGKVNDRPQLDAALKACRLFGAKLLIAKIDRLSRNAGFLLRLRDEGVEFVAADMPTANRMTVSIMAVVAEHEREAISARTKAALAAAKARGVKLGTTGPKNLSRRDIGTERGNARKAEIATERAQLVLPAIHAARAAGAMSLAQIADALNEKGIPSARGSSWTATGVKRVLDRLAK